MGTEEFDYAAVSVSDGHTAHHSGKGQARIIAERAAVLCSKPVNVYLDSSGFIVTRADNPVTRDDVTLVHTARR